MYTLVNYGQLNGLTLHLIIINQNERIKFSSFFEASFFEWINPKNFLNTNEIG